MLTESKAGAWGEATETGEKDEIGRKERQERLLDLYREMNGEKSSGKRKLLLECVALAGGALIALAILSGIVISSLVSVSLIGIWAVYIIFVLVSALALLIVWSSLRSYREVTLAWIDAWKRVELEGVRQSMRERDYVAFDLMQETKRRLKSVGADSEKDEKVAESAGTVEQ